MSEAPHMPPNSCPDCGRNDKLLMNISYIYQPDDVGEMALASITYTLQCRACKATFAISEAE